MEETTIYSAAPAENGSVNWKKRINVNDIHNYWMASIRKEQLEEDETVRLTAVLPYESKGKFHDHQITITEQVRSAEELIQLMDRKYASIKKNEWKRKVGWSMSSAIFKYIPAGPDGKPVAPTKSQIKHLSSFVIDMDSHTSKDRGERFHFNSYTNESRRLIAGLALAKINDLFNKLDMDLVIKPNHAYSTGGGLQFIAHFQRPINQQEAETIFNHVKLAAKRMKERFVVYGVDVLDNIRSCYLDFDISSTDIAHTQRMAGTVNPKEQYMGSFSEEIPDLYNEDLIDKSKLNLFNVLDDISKGLSEEDGNIQAIRNIYNKSVIKLKELSKPFLAKNASDEMIEISSDLNPTTILHSAEILKHVNQIFKDGDQAIYKNYDDFNILKEISSEQQAAYMGSLLEVNKEASTSRYTAYRCPFHPEQNGSFAIYNNNDKPVAYAKDFHDGTVYNAISFVMALSNFNPDGHDLVSGDEGFKSRSEAVFEIASALGIELKAPVRKQFANDQVQGEVDRLISEVNVEDYVYYRLANKQRACIIREFEHGESFMFDGTKMMTEHILLNQLNKYHADFELRNAFHDKFIEKILINAFEEFTPGAGYTYERKNIKYINLWIPGKDYLKIHEMSKNIDQMDIASALGLIKERLPVMNYYLHQMTQKGSIEYFLNWLINVANFNTMSTIPVINTVQGTGKGVFVTNVLEHYLNHEYVNVVNSDKVASNFNAFMEKSSLIVLDEGDFSRSHEVDNLKLLTGNEYIQVEKKGVDSQKMKKHFNLLMMTNGETPIIHPSNDRRITYFRCDVTLLDSIKHAGFETIDEFIVALREEVPEFWAILVKTAPKTEWNNQNLKDNQFNKQILMMHPFGKLLIKMLDNEWEEIKLQMSENEGDPLIITSNLEMIEHIKNEFESTGTINLTLINKYIKSLNFKTYVSVQQFIKNNALTKNGIEIKNTSTSVIIHINKYKLKNLIEMENNLGKLFDCYNPENIDKTLSLVNAHKELDDEKVVEVLNDVGLTPHLNNDPLGLNNQTPVNGLTLPQAPNTIIQ